MSANEYTAYQHHLARCELCRQLVGQFQAVADLLPEALEEQAVSPDLKARVLAEAAAVSPGNATASPGTPLTQGDKRSRRRWPWPAWIRPSPAAAMAALVLAVISLAVWNFSLTNRLSERDNTLAQQWDMLSALAAGAPVFHLSGTEAAPASSGVLVYQASKEQAYLLVSNLPSLPAEQEYQLWRIEGQTPVDAGTFNGVDSPEQIVVVSADFSKADAIGVSIEPRGGSLSPTGPIVLLGQTG